MTALLRHPLAGVAATAILLIGLLGAMLVDRMWLITHGREVVLKIQPYDPRDLFKGDYAQLAYSITRPEEPLLKSIAGNPKWRGRSRRAVFVVLEPTAAGDWKAVAVAAALPRDLRPRQVAIAGTMTSWGVIAYGIERYFVPEGTGTRIDDLARSSQLSAVVAVDSRGRAAIKGLMHEGRRIDTAPLL